MSRAQRAFDVENLFPPGVIAFEFRGPASPDDLLPAERECVAPAVEKRVREFAAGRLCARAGLRAFGFEPAPLLQARDRTPTWPPGIVGSIAHTDSYCVAVLGRESQFAAIGVDAEYLGHLSPSLWRLTMRAEELRTLQVLDGAERRQVASVIFSAKEAFYKYQYALTRCWLGFEDVMVNIAGDAFEVSLVNTTSPIRRFPGPWVGRFSVGETFVVAGIAREHGNP